MTGDREGLTSADVGKRVLDQNGTEVGRIIHVTDGIGYVDSDPTILDVLKAKLGWGDLTTNAHPLDEGSVHQITDDAVHLSGTF